LQYTEKQEKKGKGRSGRGGRKKNRASIVNEKKGKRTCHRNRVQTENRKLQQKKEGGGKGGRLESKGRKGGKNGIKFSRVEFENYTVQKSHKKKVKGEKKTGGECGSGGYQRTSNRQTRVA